MNVPGAGELELAKRKKLRADDQAAEAAGKERLSVKARGKAKRKLNEEGKAKVEAKVTFTPEGDSEHGVEEDQAGEALGPPGRRAPRARAEIETTTSEPTFVKGMDLELDVPQTSMRTRPTPTCTGP